LTHAEDAIRRGFFLQPVVLDCTLAREVSAIFVSRKAETGNHRGDLIGIIGYQLAPIEVA
jgi:hypothetical protein